METMKVQAQIRQNAEEVSSYLSEMSKWEKSANTKVAKRNIVSSPKASAIRPGSGTVKVIEKPSTTGICITKKGSISHSSSSADLNPASLAERHSMAIETPMFTLVPTARGIAGSKDAETAERERGNTEYECGNFAAAIKSYTKCLGLKSMNYVAFSNRAMAYMKLKEYFTAESDASSALSIEPTHVKSLIRRATSRNALGKHRAALVDLNAALVFEPFNKQVRIEIQRTKELLRNSVNRAPLVSIPVSWIGENSVHGDINSNDNGIVSYQTCGNYLGPDLPYFPVELKTETSDLKLSKRIDFESENENEMRNENKNENENKVHSNSENICDLTKIEIENLETLVHALKDDNKNMSEIDNYNGNEKENESGKSVCSLRTSQEVSQYVDPNSQGEKDKALDSLDSLTEIEDSGRNSSRAKTVPKKIKKVTKTGKTNKNQILSGYELEKKLNSCGSDDASLAVLLESIDPECAGKIFGDSLEIDFIINFMKCLDKWCENEKVKLKNHENGNNLDNISKDILIIGRCNSAENVDNVHIIKYYLCCHKLLVWFEKISEISSFRILKLLLSKSQKEILLRILNKRKHNEKEDSEIVAVDEERRSKIRLLWQLEE